MNEQERAAFEAWAASYSTLPLDRDDSPAFGTTSYQDMGQAMLWEAWQARAALAAAPVQAVPETEFCWLVELFDPSTDNSLGHYHTGFTDISGASRTTKDPHKAQRYGSKDAATRAAFRLHDKAGIWRAIEHGFAAPAAAQVPADSVPMPTNADQAAAMALIGEAWLRENAPERLRAPQPAAPQVPADEDRRQAQAEAAKLKGDILKIATAITSAGFTLIQTEHGYQVRKFGPAVAQTAAPGAPQPAEPAPLTDEQMYEAVRESTPRLFELARLWAENKIHSYQFANEAEQIVSAAVVRGIRAAMRAAIKAAAAAKGE